MQIREGGVVGRHHAGAGAGFDRHVADRQPPFDAERPDGRAGIFDDVAHAARGADPGDDGEDHVLGVDAGGQRAVDDDPHVLRLALPQGLGRQHVTDLGSADAERERAERTMGRGVTVAADHDHAGLAEPLLRPDDVHNSLPPVAQPEQRQARGLCVCFQVFDNPPAVRLIDRSEIMAERRDVMVRRREGAVGPPHRQPFLLQHAEGVTRTVVDEMAIDMQQRGAVRTDQDGMRRPDLVEQRRRRSHRPYSAASTGAGLATPKRSLTASHSSAPTRRNASRTVMLCIGTG